jgi:diaminopropionate ammonia-lyase
MRMLAAPIKGDTAITSGESGAAPFGALAAIMTLDDLKDLRKELGLDKNSKLLVFSTEGDTDPIRYKNIVWKGLEK